MNSPELFPEMVGVLDTDDNFVFCMAATTLHEAGIIYDVVAIPELSGDPSKTNSNDWIRPCRILVAREDETEARSILEPYSAPTESIQQSAAPYGYTDFSGGHHGRGSVENPSRKEPPNPPLIQRVGTAMIGGVATVGFFALGIAALNGNDRIGFTVFIFIAVVCLLVTARLFRFGFSRRQQQTGPETTPSSK